MGRAHIWIFQSAKVPLLGWNWNWTLAILHAFSLYTGDRYDEEPRRGRRMDEIEDWSNGKKSVVGEALDKAKDLWNRAAGRRGPDKYD